MLVAYLARGLGRLGGLVLEECGHDAVEAVLGGVAGGALVANAGIFALVVHQEAVEVALNVHLSGFLGQLARHGLVAKPVLCLGLDEVELFHREQRYVATVGCCVGAGIHVGVVGLLVGGAGADVVFKIADHDTLGGEHRRRDGARLRYEEEEQARVVAVAVVVVPEALLHFVAGVDYAHAVLHEELRRYGSGHQVGAAFPTVDDGLCRAPRAYRFAHAAGYVVVARLVAEHVAVEEVAAVPGVDGGLRGVRYLLEHGRAAVYVGDVAKEDTGLHGLNHAFPLAHVAGIDAVHALGDGLVVLVEAVGRVVEHRYQLVGLFKHPGVDRGLGVVLGRVVLVCLRARHIAPRVGGELRRHKADGTGYELEVGRPQLLAVGYEFLAVNADIVEVAAPHRVTVHAQELPAVLVGKRAGGRLAHRGEALRQVHVVFRVVVVDLAGVEAEHREAELGRVLVGRVGIDVLHKGIVARRARESEQCSYGQYFYFIDHGLSGF